MNKEQAFKTAHQVNLSPLDYLLLAHATASMAMFCAKQEDNQGILIQLDLAERVANSIFIEYPQYQKNAIQILEICRQTRRLCQNGTPCNLDEFYKISMTNQHKPI